MFYSLSVSTCQADQVFYNRIGMPIKRAIKHVREDIKRHRPIDWFAIMVLISLAFFVGSIINDKTEQFIKDMDLEAKRLEAHMQAVQKD